MVVQELWRYPVKSMRGEQLESVDVELDGLHGDRLVYVREASGRVVTSRYRPRLLGLSATLGPGGEALVDGEPWSAPNVLAKVRAATTPDVELVHFEGVDHGQRYDVLPLTVLTDGMARAGGVEELAEASWPGSYLRIGEVVIGVRKRRSRCVMTTFDPDTLEQDASVLKRVVLEFGGTVALDCSVEAPGRIAVGDSVELRTTVGG
jgi:uncharacterized protein YcbX